ncbi:MerR family transcriptional regulator [Methylobacterium gregans]|uniref:MerR family transcriptional regulator n=1 Tax=Methylobacterium gregans TaxID=374424 RepID=UPI00360BE873
MRPFAIGTLSEQTGVKIPTIRFYESIGLLPAPERTQTNRRTYDESTVRRLRFIRNARELGFEVEAIRSLLDLADNPGKPREEVDAAARDHLADIDDRIARLTRLRSEVQVLADPRPSGQAGGRLLQALSDHDLSHHETC